MDFRDAVELTRMRWLPLVRAGVVQREVVLATQVEETRRRVLEAARNPSRWERFRQGLAGSGRELPRLQLPSLPLGL
jgi:hypothetical protein